MPVPAAQLPQDGSSLVAGSPGPAPKPHPDDADTVVGFFQVNPTFLAPYLLLGAVLHVLQVCPVTQSFFAERGMEPWGLYNATQYAMAMVVMAYGLHGLIAANHDEFVLRGMKLQEARRYLFTHQAAATRFTAIMITQICVYWSLPIRPGRDGLWGLYDFFVGLSILNILQDAWFFFVHWLCHQPGWYEKLHKTHHRWRTPTPFAAYYISKWGHFFQEHCLTVPLMLFTPVPLSSWLFFQYAGSVGSLLQHSNFLLMRVQLPFVPSLTIGHFYTLFNPWVFLLGAHTTEHHDYHHEHFHGNFQLSYTYLDKFFGTYIDPASVKPGLAEPLPVEPPVPEPAFRVDDHPAFEEP